MTLPLCTCGHSAFDHTGWDTPHVCYREVSPTSFCECPGFVAASDPDPNFPQMSQSAPAQPAAPNPFISGLGLANAQPSPYPDAAERRRYALLQAAAILLAGGLRTRTREMVINIAELLLADIEFRETGRPQEAIDAGGYIAGLVNRERGEGA